MNNENTTDRKTTAILNWCKKHNPSAYPNMRRLIDDTMLPHPSPQAQAIMLLSSIVFEAGRQFQHDTGAELNTPNIYLPFMDHVTGFKENNK